MTETVDGLEWRRVYWYRGDIPRGRPKPAVKDPPCSGWQFAVMIPGERRSTLFCPYTLSAYTVPNDSVEVAGSRGPFPLDRDWLVALITRHWHESQAFGWLRDYDTAALVLRRLDAPVPEQVLRGGEVDTRKKGGKDVSTSLKKPVRRHGKRGRFLGWFLDGGGSRPVREAMAELGMSRSNVLSYLYMLRKDHGIGYELVGDVATVELPDGCDDPFEEEAA